MKPTKKLTRLIILVSVLAVACAAAVGVTKYEEKKEKIRNSDEVFLEIPPESVTALAWDNGTESLSFHREDVWKWDEDEAFPVSQEKIGDLLGLFQSFGAAFVIEDVEDYGQYGLDIPVCTIEITTDAPETYEITLGSFSTMDAKRYLSIGDGRVYLVSQDPMELYQSGIREMIDHDEDLAYNKVYEIRLSGAQNYTVTYREDSDDALCAADVYFTERDGRTVPLDTRRVGTYLESMTTLNPYNYVNYNAGPEDLARYGLDKPELTASVDYDYIRDGVTTNGTFVIHAGRDPEAVEKAKEAARKAEDDPDFIPEPLPGYVRMGDSAIIYEITPEQYDALMAASFDDLRHREVFAADFNSVTGMDVTLEGRSYSLTYTEEDGEDGTWFLGEKEIDILPIQSALTGLLATEFTEEAPRDREEISLTVHLKDEHHPELAIRLYRYDGTSCLAAVNGSPFALVERSGVIDLAEAVNAIVLTR